MERVRIGAILATNAGVQAVKSPSGTITVTLTDVADQIDVIGAPYALIELCSRIQNAVANAAFDE